MSKENKDETMRRIILRAIENPKLQPYLWSEIIARHGLSSYDILSKHGMFKEDLIPSKSSVSYSFAHRWNALDFIKIYIGKFDSNLNTEFYNQIREIIESVLLSSEFSVGIGIQLVNIYNVISPKFIHKQDLVVFQAILDIDSTKDSTLSYSFFYDIFLSLLQADSPLTIKIFQMIINNYINYDDITRFDLLRYLIDNPDLMDKLIMQSPDEVLECLITAFKESYYNSNMNREYEIKINGNEYRSKLADDKLHLYINKEKKLSVTFESLEKVIDDVRLTINPEDSKNIERDSKLLALYPFEAYAYESIFVKDRQNSLDQSLLSLILMTLDSSKQTTEKIKEFLNDELMIVKKLGLYIIINEFEAFKEIILTGIIEDISLWNMILRFYIFGDETRQLLKLLSTEPEFSSDKILVENLDTMIKKNSFIPRKDPDKHFVFFCQSRYRELKNIEYFNAKHTELYEKSNMDYQLSAAVSHGPSGFVEDTFPYSLMDLQNMSNSQIVIAFNKFEPKEDDNLSLKQVSYEGGNNLLQELIKTSPKKILFDISPFLDLKPEFASGIMGGLMGLADSSEKTLDFYKTDVFTFSHDYITKIFSIGYTEKQFAKYFMWMVTKYKNMALEELKFLSMSISYIVDKFLETNNQKKNEFIEDSFRNLDFAALNTLIGTCIEAIIFSTITSMKNSNTKDVLKLWNTNFLPTLEKIIDSENVLIFYAVGHYLPNLNYIDSSFGEQVISALSPEADSWCSFMAGYSHCFQVFRGIISEQRKNISIALSTNRLHGSIKERLVNRVGVAYLNGYENMDELIDEVFSYDNPNFLNSLIHLAGTIKHDDSNANAYIIQTAQAKKLWGKIIEKIRTVELDEIWKSIVESLFRFLYAFTFIDDEIIKFIKSSLKLISKYNNSGIYVYPNHYKLMQYLSAHVHTKGTDLKPLILSYLVSLTPDSHEGEIKKLVDLFQQEDRQNIRTAYLEKSRGKNNIVVYITKKL